MNEKKRTYDIKQYICRYTIYQENKVVERNIIGWKTALAHARKYTSDLFNKIKKVEILNIWTGEIIGLEEAEKRAQDHTMARHRCDHIK